MSKFSEYLVVVALPNMFVVASRACVPQISRVKYAMSLIVRGAEKTSKREGSVKSACRKLWRLFYLAPPWLWSVPACGLPTIVQLRFG